MPASHLTTASSATVTATAGPRNPLANTTAEATASTSAIASQRKPLLWMWCGSGGGSPDGRRRRAGLVMPALPGSVREPPVLVPSAGTSMALPAACSA
jgi:hypothetical protein